MDVRQEIKLEIGYGIGSVHVCDVINKKNYTENFCDFIPFLYLWFSKRAEKKAIDRAMKFMSDKIFTDHQSLMK